MCVCVCVCVVRVVCVCACSVPIPSNPVPQACVGAGRSRTPTNVAGGHHARSTAHESSNAAAVAQAATRPCRPALPLVAARLHGCHDNLDSRMAAAALQGRRLRSGSQLAVGLGAFGGGGWCIAREGEVDRGAERSGSAGLVLACSTLTSLSGQWRRTRKARLLPCTFGRPVVDRA